MNAWGRRAGRWISALGAASFAAYLVWRVTASMRGAPLWLSIPALVVEITGFVTALTVIVALWPAGERGPVRGPVLSPDDDLLGDDLPPLVDIVVRTRRQELHEVRTTLLAIATGEPHRLVSVIDLDGRPEVAALATEFAATYIASDPRDHSGLAAAHALRDDGTFLVLDAGDVPSLGIIGRLLPTLDDPDVAIVQGRVTTVTNDSAEHGPNGAHELAFERDALNPALGRRGAGILTGSGALVRRAALSPLDPAQWIAEGDEATHVQWTTSIRLVEAGWKVVVADGPPVVALRSLTSADEVAADRERESGAARTLLTGPYGVLRPNRLRLRQRLGYAAWTLRPLSGLRRLAFVAVLLAALVAGELPFRPDPVVLAAVWLPAFVLIPLGLGMLSGWTLRPGDRLRTSLRTVGPALHSILHGVTRRHPMEPGATGRPARRANVPRSLALVSIAIAINVVIAGRGISDRWTGTLGSLEPAERAGLLAVALWVLAGCLDALRLLLRRTQQRRAVRVASSMAGSLSGRSVFLTDLTTFGAGIVADQPPHIGTTMQLDAVIPTRSGVTTISAPSLVRNVGRDISGGWRIGLEFVSLDPAGANALAEFCVIEPARAALGGRTVEPIESGITIDDLAPMPMLTGQRRLLLRATTLFAVAGVVASAGPGAAEASAIPVHRVTGIVTATAAPTDPPVPSPDGSTTTTIATTVTVTSTSTSTSTVTSTTSTPVVSTDEPPAPTGVAGATIVGVCSDDAGPDGIYGTSDDSYTSPISTTSGTDGTYVLDLGGRACWVSLAPPPGYETSSDAPATLIVDASTANATADRVDLRPTPRTSGAGSAPAEPAPGVNPTGSVTARVWTDHDADGALDADEHAVAGVTITLYDDGGAAIADGATDAGGATTFTGLARGRYDVGVTNLPEGVALIGATSVTGRTGAVDVDGANVEIRAALHESERASGNTPGAPTATLLPAPAATLTANPGDRGTERLGPIVIMLAAVIGVSVVLGAARPRRREALSPPAG